MPQLPLAPRRRVSLQIKLAVGLVVIVMTPLLASAYLIDELSKVAANFESGEAGKRHDPLEHAKRAYLELFDVSKELQAEVARRLAALPPVAAVAAGTVAGADAEATIDEILESEPGLQRIAVTTATGRTIERTRALPDAWRAKSVEPIRLADGARLELAFAVRATLQDEYQQLEETLRLVAQATQVRSALPASYQRAFLALMAGAVVVATLIGVLASRRVTRRVGVLLDATREIAAGKLDTRVALGGRDEMAELATAFNAMLDELEHQRAQVDYLQRIGAWQDVARRLAHEIKNPLTPIQLAVQQCVSTYPGDDARFKRLLGDTGEIVEEEIASLRRLVDTFRTLGQLPRVEAHPIVLADVVDDLLLDPSFGDRLVVRKPDESVDVRADRLLLKRVLYNLVENGVHAGTEASGRGEVVVGWTADRKAGVARITVDDAGKGVAEADRQRIFDPYVTSKATGTGLGLAISKKIAIEHGGTLDVAATPAPTGGARFVLTIPLA